MGERKGSKRKETKLENELKLSIVIKQYGLPYQRIISSVYAENEYLYATINYTEQ